MQADPHKLDFRSDLLARLPGAGGLGPLGPMGGALPPTHDLTGPPSLFSATGASQNIRVRRNVLRGGLSTSFGRCWRLTSHLAVPDLITRPSFLQGQSIRPRLPSSLHRLPTPPSSLHLHTWVRAA